MISVRKYNELTRIPPNRNLLLRRTMIEYESESLRWMTGFPCYLSRKCAHSAILQILQKIYIYDIIFISRMIIISRKLIKNICSDNK